MTEKEELEKQRLEAIEAPVEREKYRLGPGDRLAVTLNLPTQRVLESVVTAEGTLIVPPAYGIRVAGLSIEEAQAVVFDSLRVYFKGISPHLDLMSVRRFEVYALGLVSKPGSYVVDGATRAAAVIDMAGDVVPGGSRRSIRVQAADGSSRRVDLVKFLAIGDRDANPVLQDGDWVVVPHTGETAVIRGAVSRPGSYEVLEGETVLDLIVVSGGSLASADRARVELRRFVTPSGLQTESALIDLDGPTASTTVQPGDQIFVPQIPEYHLQRTAVVEGEVLYPGTYVIDEGEETLSQLIARAGGLTEDASLHEATLTRSVGADTIDTEFERLKGIPVADMSRDEYEYFKLKSREKKGRVAVDFEAVFERGDKSADILLRRGDTIMIPVATYSIDVAGQVASPGAIAFEEGRDVRWYIKQAGGYGWRADGGKTRVIRSRTGQWVSADEVDELEPGDTIWIPERSDRGFWSGVKEGLVVVGQLLTVYLVIDAISN
jgi:protein involved in polysaccharide export with SLBB domain